MKNIKLKQIFYLSLILATFLSKTEAFSECRTNVNTPEIPQVNNCLALIAYYQAQGQNPQKWCENKLNYQQCCITCQNYLRQPYCSDIANEADCRARAFLGLCDTLLTNNVLVRTYCRKSCGDCSVPSLTCNSLYIGCNSGFCSHTSYFGVQSICCNCPAGRGGPYCNLVNPCLSSPCRNGGVCTPNFDDADSTYKCSCPAGCRGTNCELCDNPCTNFSCLNGGYCSVTSIGTPICVCPAYYNGTFCEKLINACESYPCRNGAECVPLYLSQATYTCKCLSGCSGQNCEICNTGCNNYPCLNGGYCTLNPNGLPYCICPSGYIGSFCETMIQNSCSSRPCLNGGSCISWQNMDYKCICPPNYTGRNCNFIIPSDICIRGDMDRNLCLNWKLYGFCNQNYLYENIPVPMYCPQSCGICNFPPCLDVDANCPLWASYGLCAHLNINYPGLCKRSCNAC